jgi:hypothetical protein
MVYLTPAPQGYDTWRVLARSRRATGGMVWDLATLKIDNYRNFRIKGTGTLSGSTPTSYPYLFVTINGDITASTYQSEYTKHWDGVITETDSPVTTSIRMGELPTAKNGYFTFDLEVNQPIIPPREVSSTTPRIYTQIKGRCDVVDTTTPNAGYFLFSGMYTPADATTALTRIEIWMTNYGSASPHHSFNFMIPASVSAVI